MASTVHSEAVAYIMDDNKIKSMDTQAIKKYLFRFATQSKWEEVVRTYGLNKNAHGAKITKSGDTALHIAVSDGQEEHVEKLVKLITEEELKIKNERGSIHIPARMGNETNLKIQNERGNTPLHIAAWMGNETMCSCIAKDHPSLVGAQNVDNETPLFLAAAYGKKDAFLLMHYICTPNGHPKHYNYCRRNDGNTILHVAISRQYFDLAFQIIHLYEDLVNSVNEEGISPLHLLATKPSAFRSGSHLGLFEEIIYYCIYVDELKVGRSTGGIIKTFNEEKNPKYPENYQTCINFIRLFRTSILSVIKNQSYSADPENPIHPVQRGELKAADPESPLNTSNPGSKSNVDQGLGRHQKFPVSYNTCFDFVKLLSKALMIVVKLLSKALMIVFGLGSTEIRRMKAKKEKHRWSVQIVNELLKRAAMYEYEDSGMNPQFTTAPSHTAPSHTDQTTPYNIDGGPSLTPPDNGKEKIPEASSADQKADNKTPSANRETPIQIAAKHGVTEMVEKILEHFPVAIHDTDAEKKNIVLLAVEYRQLHVYKLLLQRGILRDSLFGRVDHEGNSALHLAAKLGDYPPSLFLRPALQMQWEIKWYEFVRTSMPVGFFTRYNKKNQTAREIFSESHAKLVKEGGEWLTKTSQNCSVMGGLVATVAFATATAVPGGIREATGTPILENQAAFEVFAISSLLALCSSVTSMAIFLSILMSRLPERAFGKELPIKFLVGLTTLFLSIISMMVSFCGGHYFMLKDKLKHFAVPVYLVACMPLAFFAIIQLPLYCNLIYMNFKKVP